MRRQLAARAAEKVSDGTCLTSPSRPCDCISAESTFRESDAYKPPDKLAPDERVGAADGNSRSALNSLSATAALNCSSQILFYSLSSPT